MINPTDGGTVDLPQVPLAKASTVSLCGRWIPVSVRYFLPPPPLNRKQLVRYEFHPCARAQDHDGGCETLWSIQWYNMREDAGRIYDY